MRFIFTVAAVLFIAACDQGEPSQGGGEETMEEGLYVEVAASEDKGGINVEATLGNGEDDPVELTFNTTQRIEVRLYEKGKKDQPVYRSSREMMYNQVIGTLMLDPGEETNFSEDIPALYLTEGTRYKGDVAVTVARVDEDDSPSKPSGSFTIEM
ncbi:BsuPI-related putative proteinase inhibitor [Natribacillus halophilus]|uniref:Intracellular proteinase inhibitor n=1 Tax=Natribacillus halophilus TaxID=549003 RepID=A0A1G8LI88_9BACI|nr:BsuPI-related putative proteinase inhibitor [Natribacillus halophilus]SDI55363.1 Intracellular proteinase inhibitor [Natribacillus halophilus]